MFSLRTPEAEDAWTWWRAPREKLAHLAAQSHPQMMGHHCSFHHTGHAVQHHRDHDQPGCPFWFSSSSFHD